MHKRRIAAQRKKAIAARGRCACWKKPVSLRKRSRENSNYFSHSCGNHCCFGDSAPLARRAAAACAVLGLLMSFSAPLLPLPAAAFALFGMHIWGKKPDEAANIIGEAKYYSLSFAPFATSENVPEAKAKAIEARAALSIKLAKANSLLWAGRKKAVAGSGGVLAKARGDYSRLLAGFYAAGRYGPVISIIINGQEAANIPYGTELPEHNEIVIRVDSGAQYYFDKVELGRIGSSPLAGEAKLQKTAALEQKKIGYARGELAQSGVILAAEAQVTEKWRQRGYAKAKIVERRVIADHAAKSVNALIEVEPGQQAHFGALTMRNISAQPHMNPAYIAWLTGLKEGELYHPAALAKANARLNRLEVFRSVALNEAETIQPNGLLPLSLIVQERPLRRFGGGGAYSTIDGLGLSAYWLHRNLFGHGERLRFEANAANIAGDRNKSSSDPKDYSYNIGGTFIRPGIMTPDTDYVASLRAEREVLDNYTAKGVYFSNGFNHNFNDRLTGHIYANAAQMRIKDDIWGHRDFTAIGLSGGLLYDSRDNKNDATRGYYGQIAAQPFYEAEYGNMIGKMTAEGRTYFAFDNKNRLVFAVRGKIGTIGGAPIAELPSNMLFFIGGGGSVRGYAYRSIGIYKKGDKIIGGRSQLEGSAELRAALYGAFGLVGFIDAGIVGQDSAPDFDQNAKLGAGLGLRYKTGMGPLRLDVALPLNRERGDSRYGLYIGIGQAF